MGVGGDCPMVVVVCERILELFSDLTRHELRHDGQVVQTFHPELTALQAKVLELLQIPTTHYTPDAPTR